MQFQIHKVRKHTSCKKSFPHSFMKNIKIHKIFTFTQNIFTVMTSTVEIFTVMTCEDQGRAGQEEELELFSIKIRIFVYLFIHE